MLSGDDVINFKRSIILVLPDLTILATVTGPLPYLPDESCFHGQLTGPVVSSCSLGPDEPSISELRELFPPWHRPKGPLFRLAKACHPDFARQDHACELCRRH